LTRHLPSDLGSRTYHEPFVGAASLFFFIQPERAVLSDANEHLMNCYVTIRDHPDLVYTYLRKHGAQSSESYYYAVRDRYNIARHSVAQAARFVYLNKTCFNGIFRVNTKGQFNVPYGHKEPPALPSRGQLRAASGALKRAELSILPFEQALQEVSDSDFVYLDPPYPPLNGTSYFTHYTTDRFCESDQKRLAQVVQQLDRAGCKFMMTNADIPLIRGLYGQFNIAELSVRRYITCRASKHQVTELVITNYDIGL